MSVVGKIWHVIGTCFREILCKTSFGGFYGFECTCFMTDARVMLNGFQYARSYYDNNWIYRLSYKVAKIKHSEVVWEPRPVHVCVCIWTTSFWFWCFDGPVHLCVCVLGPPVLGFGSFHSFDGPAHLCACTWTSGFGGFHGFDGPVHQNHENHQNPKPLLHVHAHRWTGPSKP